MEAISYSSLNVFGATSFSPKISQSFCHLLIRLNVSAILSWNAIFSASVNFDSFILYSLIKSNNCLEAGFSGSALYMSGISLILLVCTEFCHSFMFIISHGFTSTIPSEVNNFVPTGKMQNVPEAHFFSDTIFQGVISCAFMNFILFASKSSVRTYIVESSWLGQKPVSIGIPFASFLNIYMTSFSDNGFGYHSLLLWYRLPSSHLWNHTSMSWVSLLKSGRKASLGSALASIEIFVDSIMGERATNIPCCWISFSNSKTFDFSSFVNSLYFFLYNSLSSEKNLEVSNLKFLHFMVSIACNTWFLSFAFSTSGNLSYGTSNFHHFAHEFLFNRSSWTFDDISSNAFGDIDSHFNIFSYTKSTATLAASRFSYFQSDGKSSNFVLAMSTWFVQFLLIHSVSFVSFILGSYVQSSFNLPFLHSSCKSDHILSESISFSIHSNSSWYFLINLSDSHNSLLTQSNSHSTFLNSLFISSHLLALSLIACCLVCEAGNLSSNHFNSCCADCKSALFWFKVWSVFLDDKYSDSQEIKSLIALWLSLSDFVNCSDHFLGDQSANNQSENQFTCHFSASCLNELTAKFSFQSACLNWIDPSLLMCSALYSTPSIRTFLPTISFLCCSK